MRENAHPKIFLNLLINTYKNILIPNNNYLLLHYKIK